MKSQVFEKFTVTWLPMLGLALFILSFGTVFFWVFCYKPKGFYKKMSRIPFQKDEL